MSNGTMVPLESPDAVMYALFDLEGLGLPNSGNLLSGSQKAIYGRKDDADQIARLTNQVHRYERFIVVRVNVTLVDDITVPVA